MISFVSFGLFGTCGQSWNSGLRVNLVEEFEELIEAVDVVQLADWTMHVIKGFAWQGVGLVIFAPDWLYFVLVLLQIDSSW